MTEVTRYLADDGTEFEDEYDCRQYEWEQNVESADYVLLNHKYEKMPNNNPSSYDECAFIFIPTRQSAWDLLDNWNDALISIDVPHFLPYRPSDEVDTGLWAWDEDKERWYHLGNKIAELTTMAENVMNVINGV